MKIAPLTIRRCPPKVRTTYKRRAKLNGRSVSAEMLATLERDALSGSPVTGKQWAERLRGARKLLSEEEHRRLAEDIEKSRKLMNREHLR